MEPFCWNDEWRSLYKNTSFCSDQWHITELTIKFLMCQINKSPLNILGQYWNHVCKTLYKHTIGQIKLHLVLANWNETWQKWCIESHSNVNTPFCSDQEHDWERKFKADWSNNKSYCPLKRICQLEPNLAEIMNGRSYTKILKRPILFR